MAYAQRLGRSLWREQSCVPYFSRDRGDNEHGRERTTWRLACTCSSSGVDIELLADPNRTTGLHPNLLVVIQECVGGSSSYRGAHQVRVLAATCMDW